MDRKKIKTIIKILKKRYKIKVKRDKPFKVLVGTILSQRTKDEITDLASKRLFEKADTPKKILALKFPEIEKLIYPVGFYKQKTEGLKELSKILVEKYRGKVPNNLEELKKLPFVGDKTASCVLLFGFNKNTIPVDTHVARISKRLGLVEKNLSPEKIRVELERYLEGEERDIINQLFIFFGKEICKPIKPNCKLCPIQKYCGLYKKVNN